MAARPSPDEPAHAVRRRSCRQGDRRDARPDIWGSQPAFPRLALGRSQGSGATSMTTLRRLASDNSNEVGVGSLLSWNRGLIGNKGFAGAARS
jgi:hypothetical protein